MARQSQERNFNQAGLKGFQYFLEESLAYFQQQLNLLSEADNKLSESLVKGSKAAYTERTKAIQDELEKKLEDFSTIIQNVQYSNIASQETDSDIASHFGAK